MPAVNLDERARIIRGVKRALVTGVASLAGMAVLCYTADYVVFRYRAAHGQGLGQVMVTSYDAVAQKNGKTEFLFNAPEPQVCANALFPRQGYAPCWYLQRHTEQRTNI